MESPDITAVSPTNNANLQQAKLQPRDPSTALCSGREVSLQSGVVGVVTRGLKVNLSFATSAV